MRIDFNCVYDLFLEVDKLLEKLIKQIGMEPQENCLYCNVNIIFFSTSMLQYCRLFHGHCACLANCFDRRANAENSFATLYWCACYYIHVVLQWCNQRQSIGGAYYNYVKYMLRHRGDFTLPHRSFSCRAGLPI